MEKAEPLKPDTHGNRRDLELFGKRAGEMPQYLIVTGLVEGADDCRRLFIHIARNHNSIISPKHPRMFVAELIAPCVKD